MEDVRCSFEIARLLDEKRFDWPCDYFYIISTKKLYQPGIKLNEYSIRGVLYRCPTYQHVARWLRDIHKTFVCVDFYYSTYDRKIVWNYDIRFMDDREKIDVSNKYDSYEDAIAGGVKYVLENILEVW